MSYSISKYSDNVVFSTAQNCGSGTTDTHCSDSPLYKAFRDDRYYGAVRRCLFHRAQKEREGWVYTLLSE